VLAAFWRRAGGFLAAFRRFAGGFLAAFLEKKPSGDWCHVTNQLSARLLAAFWRRAGSFLAAFRRFAGGFLAACWRLSGSVPRREAVR